MAICALAWAATPARAEGEQDSGSGARVGLRDALTLAVAQNASLAQETVDIGIAEARIAETYGIDDWILDASGNWASSRTEPVSGQQFQQLASDRLSLGGGLTRPLADGGRVGVRFDGNYNKSTSQFEFMGMAFESESTVFAPAVSVNFFQPLMRGFGEKQRDAARASLKVQRSVEELERETAAANVVRDVIFAYWDLALAVEQLKISKQSLALAQEQLRITQALVDGGKIARTELLAVEQIIAERDEAIMTAEQYISDRSIELRYLVGMEIGPGAIDLVPTDRLDTSMSLPDLDKSLEAALAYSPLMRTLREQKKGVEVQLYMAEDAAKPQLDFTAAAGPSGNSDEVGDAFGQMVTFGSWQIQAGVVFTMPMGATAARAREQQALGQMRKIKITEADATALIAAQVVRAVNALRAASKQFDTASKAIKLAEQNIEAEKVRWQQGRSTNFDVLLRQDELAQAQLRQARALATDLQATAALEAMTGELLARYGIALVPAS
jgi:outer membrane protein TolC